QSFQVNTFDDLSGLIFTDRKTSTLSVHPVSDDRLSPGRYSSMRDIFSNIENHNHFPNSTMRTNDQDLGLPTLTNKNSPNSVTFIPENQVKNVNAKEVTESHIFQGQDSRISTPDIEKGRVIDAISAERV